jgi:plasmid stabilization system protein ParE
MVYLVKMSARAERDFTNLYNDIHAEQSDAAWKWFADFRDAILSLSHLPYRCSVTPEKDELRQLLYGRKPHIYRVIYRILEKKKAIEVLHIRHGARRKFRASDLR